jgi:hypothetical protein
MAPPVLHVCCGDSAAELIRASLGLPASAVLILRDDLAVGPLVDVDDARPQARADFWADVLAGEALEAIESGGPMIDLLAAEAEILKHLSPDRGRITLWHGTGAAEQLMLRRALWALRDATVPVVEEVAVGKGSFPGPGRGRGGMTAVAMLAPGHVARTAATARPVAPDRRARLAASWEALRADGGGLRHAEGDGETITTHPIDAHDEEILAAAGPDWMPAARVIGQPMGEITGFFATDSFVFWRLRQLAALGRVEFDGPPTAIRGCRVRRVD